MSGDYLVGTCTSPDHEDSDYCDGYLDISFGWRLMAACDSPLPADQSFCAGSKAADVKSKELIGEECVKCDTDKKTCVRCNVKEFVVKLRAKMGTCSRLEHDQNYCAAYNASAESHVFSQVAIYADWMALAPRELGQADRYNSLMFSLIGGLEAINRWQPCVPKQAVDAKQIRNAFVDFVRENPEQRKNRYSILVFLWALYYKVCPTVSPELHPNAEVCTAFTWRGEKYGTQNVCDRPVVVQLLSGDSSTVTLHELKPGEIFLIERNSLRLFTTCMVGYVPSVPFTPANHDAINMGRYHCVKQ
jgi:hypothetical protein